jgi:hypothetical protein
MNGARPDGFLEDEREILRVAGILRFRGYPQVAHALKMELYHYPGDHAETRREAEVILGFTNAAEVHND